MRVHVSKGRKVPNMLIDPFIIVMYFVSLRLTCNFITKTRLFKYIENVTSKNWKISYKKNSDIFHISAQNIDCGYSLEPP